MKKIILFVCIFILVFLFSCDINAIDELLSKPRRKFLLEENKKKVEALNFELGNQEGQEKQEDVVVKNNEKGLEINKKTVQEKVVKPYQDNVLSSDQKSYLIARDAEANDIKSKVDVKLSEISKHYNELNNSLLNLKNMEVDVIKANDDFNKSRSSFGNGYVKQVLPSLNQAIDKAKSSIHIAIVKYEDKFNALKIAKIDVEHAKISIDSALGESEQARTSGYYYVDRMVDYISRAKTSLNEADNLFKKVKLEIDSLQASMKEAEKDFANLKNAYQELLRLKNSNKGQNNYL